MSSRVTSVATSVAHLVGPGKLTVVNRQLAFSTGEQSPLRLDPVALHTVICYGPVGISDEAMRMLWHHDVQVAWLTSAGQRCRGRLVRSGAGTTVLRLQQYQVLLDSKHKQALAQDIVARKIETQIAAARHYQRQGVPEGGRAHRQLKRLYRRCHAAGSLDELRGLEGAASAEWFTCFGYLLMPPWQFQQRVRRPPIDPVNGLLSLGYTLLLNRTVARLEATGLEVMVATLHAFRPGRPSLACDLIEPLRVPSVDRWVVRVCNKHQVAPGDFLMGEHGVRLQSSVFPQVLASWEEYWYKQAHEEVLEGLVTGLVARIRRVAAPLPILLGGGEKGRDSGNSASDCAGTVCDKETPPAERS